MAVAATDAVVPAVATHDAEAIVKNSLVLFGGQFAIKFFSFAINVLIIRHLGAEQYGKYAICVAFGGLFTIFSDFGLATLAVKRIAHDRGALAAIATNVLALRLLLALLVIGLTTLSAWLVGYDRDLRIGVAIASVGLVSYALLGVSDAVFMGLEDFRRSAVLSVVSQAGILGLSAALVYATDSFLGMLGGPTLAVAVVGCFALRSIDRRVQLRARINLRAWAELVRSAIPFAAIMLALAVSYKADTVLLSIFVSPELVGAYAVAYSLIFSFAALSHSVNLVLFPALTRQYALSRGDATGTFAQILRYLAFVSLPIGVFVSLNARAIVRTLYGEHLVAAATPLMILAWVVPLMFLAEFLGYVAIVVNRESLAARSNWVASLINVGANAALIPVFGINVAAIMTVVTELVLVVQYGWSLRPYAVFDAWQSSAIRLVVPLLMLSGTILVLRAMGWPLFPIGIICVLVYLAAAVGTKTIGSVEWQFLQSLLRSGKRDPVASSTT